MNDSLFLAVYFAAWALGIVGGLLMAFWPDKFVSFVAWLGRVPPESRKWVAPGSQSLQSRAAGIVIAIVSVVGVVLPISWMLRGRHIHEVQPSPIPSAPVGHFSFPLLVGLLVFTAVGVSLVVKPAAVLKWWFRNHTQSTDWPLGHKLISVRVFGAIFAIIAVLAILRMAGR